MKKVLFALALLTAGVYFSGCLKNNDVVSCPYQDIDPTKVTKVDSQIAKVKDYLAGKGIADYIQDSTGFFYQVIMPGTGTVSPVACSQVAVTYKGSFTNDQVFDQATEPVGFYLGGVIAGWQLGLKKIKAGGKMKLFIPPYLGYGNTDRTNPSTGAVVIPKNSILIFEVDLEEVL